LMARLAPVPKPILTRPRSCQPKIVTQHAAELMGPPSTEERRPQTVTTPPRRATVESVPNPFLSAAASARNLSMHQLQLPARDRLHQSPASVPVVPQRAWGETQRRLRRQPVPRHPRQQLNRLADSDTKAASSPSTHGRERIKVLAAPPRRSSSCLPTRTGVGGPASATHGRHPHPGRARPPLRRSFRRDETTKRSV